jgi:large subunit ribosomal protein L23
MKPNPVLRDVRLTEKANKLSSEFGQYTFRVDPAATKHAIAAAVEDAFKVTVRRVNVLNYRGKNKRTRKGLPTVTSDYKKAIVTLKAGDKIEVTA